MEVGGHLVLNPLIVTTQRPQCISKQLQSYGSVESEGPTERDQVNRTSTRQTGTVLSQSIVTVLSVLLKRGRAAGVKTFLRMLVSAALQRPGQAPLAD
ncbi:hypothetical protein UPYG_G00333950 [Umbra pygmaea]|uniref:Uncharacterized protein n=1 Tax=Umbra pygmaea TaxID=75934 RepID=A0ABD0WH87_UMBPY